MKCNVRLDLAGFDETLAEVHRVIDNNLEKVANLVETSAKTSSAFSDKTGKLRGSIKKSKSRYEDGGYIVVAKAPHSHLVEYGHVMLTAKGAPTKLGRVPAHPFMRPAKEQGIRLAMAMFGNK